MRTTQIRELWQRVVTLPAGTTYCDVYLAISGREDGILVLGIDQQYSLFYTLCDLAALCEGADLVLNGKQIKPEQYLRAWRQEFKAARPITDSGNSDLVFSATLIADPQKLIGADNRWRLEQLERLRSLHAYVEREGMLEFTFDLANPAHSKMLYEYRTLHHIEEVSPVRVTKADQSIALAAQPDLWELLA